MDESVELFMYVGPTGYGMKLTSTSKIKFLRPARRGDIERLVDGVKEPSCIALVDGTFHSYPSIGHMEIRFALEHGWTVWGLSSMGAIRAAEMRHLGVHGYGRVYRRYIEDDEFTDDEVTLVHQAEAPYMPVSEPLIHVREFIRTMVLNGIIDESAQDKIISALKKRCYSDRTLPLLSSLLVRFSNLESADVKKTMSDFDIHRIKRTDLCEFISSETWKIS